ncbi:hypothetical protein B4N89_43675 [Embleya scabrispora]|uniref:Uncharacterized protein n=1 Tax=Embleya scabrispora TaxID=159449 RepID=A0A1T3NL06_9ACTN|nr:hypothetical protein [Embleya scabrispora]OPC77410.1 hypothetical protein B4N89_43675 [Embleya scabrispora]
MSDDVLSVIPSDPQWQPERDAVDAVVALVADLAPGRFGGVAVEIDVSWYDAPNAVDCGANLERIGCPLCRGDVDPGWWGDLLEAHRDEGFPTLAVEVPCCGGSTTLDALDYDWPCGFARFEIAVWNPGRTWFDGDELARLAAELGHPVKQIQAHV